MVPLADKYPEQAMSRFESGQFPINAASKMAYVKAASALGRMDQVDIQVHSGLHSERMPCINSSYLDLTSLPATASSGWG